MPTRERRRSGPSSDQVTASLIFLPCGRLGGWLTYLRGDATVLG
jgi:hypothetical protein